MVAIILIHGTKNKFFRQLFHDGGPYHIETNLWIFSAKQWTDFYMIGAAVMKALKISLVNMSKLDFLRSDWIDFQLSSNYFAI